MSNISKINGLDISAADAQYVAAGNVDGPLGYNSIASASYIDPTFISASAAAAGFGSAGATPSTASWAIQAQTASYSTTLGATLQTGGLGLRLRASDGTVLSEVSIAATSSSYAATASYSTTLGAEIINPVAGQLRLRNSNGSTISTINGFTASLASTSSYYISDGNTISSIGSGIEIQGNTRIFLTASNNINLAAPNGVNINTDAKLNSFVTMTALTSQSMNHVLTYNPTNGLVHFTASSAIGGGGGSTTSASFASTASFVNTLNQNVTINGNLTVFGTASYTLVSASQLNVGTNTISVNVFEPAQRFGGLIVYDSGSLSHQATSSFLWDSEKNKWIYQNVSGAGYDGGMAMFGPRNTAGLGNEQGTTNNALMKGQGGDHITSSRIFDDGTNVYTNSNVQITGSLTVTGDIIATASWANNAVTASYINPTFISASAAASGFGSGGGGPESDPIFTAWSGSAASYFAGTASYALSSAGVAGGVTSITAGDGISVNQSTGAVTISATGGSTGGTNLGLVYAVSLGYLMP